MLQGRAEDALIRILLPSHPELFKQVVNDSFPPSLSPVTLWFWNQASHASQPVSDLPDGRPTDAATLSINNTEYNPVRNITSHRHIDIR
jgi:hypothetical protein